MKTDGDWKPQSDHRRLDERSLALHLLIAEKIRDNPALLERARANVERWSATCSGSWLEQWRAILQRSPDEIVRLITEHSERAADLRQSTPFTGILTRHERRIVYDSYSARTYHQSRQ